MDLNKVKEYLSNVKKSINELSVYDLDVYTAIELYYRISSKMNEVIKEVNIHTDCFDYLLNDGLVEEVIKKIDSLVADGTMDRIINQEVFGEINNLLNELSTRLDQTIIDIDNKLNKLSTKIDQNINQLSKEMKSVGINSGGASFESESDTIVKRGFLSLSNTNTWAYYDSSEHPEYYPSVELNKEGELVFSGEGKILEDDFLSTPKIDNMLHIATLFHIDIIGYEGIPLWTYIIGINDNDYNDSILLPVRITTDGKILVKNVGEPKYYSRLDFSSMRVKLNGHRNDLILEEISRKIKNVFAKGNLKNIVYFSDLHHNINDKVTPFYRRNITLKAFQLVENLLNPICFISGGDNIVDTPYRQQTIACHKEVYSAFKKDKFIYTNGNHDISILENPNEYIHPFNIKPFFNNSKTVFGGDDKYYSYTDYDDFKLRIISMDTSEVNFNLSDIAGQVGTFVSDEQINWIKNNAMNMEGKTDWNVLIVMHMLPIDKTIDDDTTINNAQQIRQLFEDFKYGSGDFSSQGRINLCCVLGGHEHRDEIKHINGINYFRTILSWETDFSYTLSDGTSVSTTRRRGNKTEIAFNILSIDNVNKKMIITRVGQDYTLKSETLDF